MNIPKRLLGRYVEIQWMDPCFQRTEHHKMLKGRAACATWLERGVIKDITDNIVLIFHSVARNPGEVSTEDDEMCYTPIHEALIEKIRVFGEPVETLE